MCEYRYQLNLLLLLVPCDTRGDCTEYRILTLERTEYAWQSTMHTEGKDERPDIALLKKHVTVKRCAPLSCPNSGRKLTLSRCHHVKNKAETLVKHIHFPMKDINLICQEKNDQPLVDNLQA